MRNRIAVGILVALCALALVTPAFAVTVGNVDYTLLAKYGILMEGSDDCPHNLPGGIPPAGKICMNITGNVAVSDPNNPADQKDGRLQIGSKNDIVGEAIANRILFGTLSQSDSCEFNFSVPAPSVGPAGQCITPPVPAPPLPLVAWPPLGAVTVEPCVNLAATPSITVLINGSASPVPGCYKDVVVNQGGVLNLQAGAYIFKSLTLKNGPTFGPSTLNGNGATVNVQGHTSTDNGGIKISDVTIETPAVGAANPTFQEFIVIANGSKLNNVILYAPTSSIHLHLGTTGNNVEAVAYFLTVEPVILTKTTVVEECACFGGPVTQFLAGSTLSLLGGTNLNDPKNKFFLSPTCDPTAPPAVQITPNPNPPAADTAIFDLTGKNTANMHVLVQSTAGTFCSADVLP